MDLQNKKSSDNQSQLYKQLDVLKKLLECPVCLQTTETSMFLCAQGHSICSGCHKKVKTCPVCKKGLLNTRNLLVERILGTLESPCIYTKEGCPEIVTALEKNSHFSKCYFRPITCDFSSDSHNCKGSRINYSNYIRHLKIVHKMIGVQGSNLNVSQYVNKDMAQLSTDIPWHQWPIQFIEAYDQTFITGSTIKSGKMFWWLYIFGDKCLSEQYVVKISLQNQQSGIEMSWSGPVMSIRTHPDLIQRRGFCLMVTKENFRPFAFERNSKSKQNDSATVQLKIGWNLIFRVSKNCTSMEEYTEDFKQ